MPLWRQDGTARLGSTALLGIAGTGAAFGALQGLMPDPSVLLPLALAGVAAGVHRWRDRQIAARLKGLKLSVTLPTVPDTVASPGLTFLAQGPGLWGAQHQDWQLSILWAEGQGLPWQLQLQHARGLMPPALPSAASLDALLALSRGLLVDHAATRPAAMMDCDLFFPLAGLSSGGEDGLIALAEGGYALQLGDSCSAVGADLAELLLCRRGAVASASP